MRPLQRGQPYAFGFVDTLLAEIGNVPLDALHRDAEAICLCYEKARPLAESLGVEAPRPRLAGFAYCHVSTLGAAVVFPRGSEPVVRPVIREPHDIDRLREPGDYLNAGVVPQRLRTFERLTARCPHAVATIGHEFEGPLTTATLLMGPQFFCLPYEDPQRAHRLLEFCVESALNYAQTIRARLGLAGGPGTIAIPDDFAGILPPTLFEEFVMPYWERLYQGLQATRRRLHSELLQKDHLPFLADLEIAEFDPSADQYLTPELLRAHCPVPFTGRILSWEVRNNSPRALQTLYRRIAACRPVCIAFHMTALEEEEKIVALLEVARELAAGERPEA